MVSKIDKFWAWFAEHSNSLAQHRVPETVVSELDQRLRSFCQLDWEIGPAAEGGNFFALSPRGNVELLNEARQMIALAPALADWEFLVGKPRRSWNLIFSVECSGKTFEIDARRWEFVLYRFKDGMCDLLLKPDRSSTTPEECLAAAGVVISDGELGEEKRLEFLNKIEIVSSWKTEELKTAKVIKPGLLSSLISSSEEIC